MHRISLCNMLGIFAIQLMQTDLKHRRKQKEVEKEEEEEGGMNGNRCLSACLILNSWTIYTIQLHKF